MTAAQHLSSLLPRRGDYRLLRTSWRGDLLAGLTVGIVALPLALAFGVSSGAGPESGLVTAIVAGVVAAVFGGSNIQVSGPTGAMVVILGPMIAAHGIGILAPLGLMAGAMVTMMGVLRLGRAVSYIPWPVIEGFTLGIAVIIFLQQVPAAIGSSAGSSSNALVAAIQSFAHFDPVAALWSLAIGVVVAAIMVLAPRLHRNVPGSIIAIVVVSIPVFVFSLPVSVIGALPSKLPAPVFPVFGVDTLSILLGPAAAVAALAAIESLLSARVAASISDTGPYDADRELVGQGLASIASGFFGGMPATGAIARTAVNVRSGARTRVAAITHSLILLGFVYLASGAVAAIPLAALAGVLMVTAVRMVSIATVRSIVGSGRSDAMVFIVTALITVSFDLIIAVGIGIVVAAFFALRALSDSSGVYREDLPVPAMPGDEQIALFRLDGALFFGASDKVLERVTAISNVRVVILRMSQLQILDATGARVITDLVHQLERRGITVLIKGIQERHLVMATRVGVISSLRHQNHLFTDLPAAVVHARSHVARSEVGAEGPAAEGPAAEGPAAEPGR